MDEKEGLIEAKIVEDIKASEEGAVIGKVITAQPVLVEKDKDFKGDPGYLAENFVKSITDSDEIKESHRIVRLKPHETFEDGLTRLQDPEILSTAYSQCMCCTSYSVLKGQIGCATRNGRTHFLPPGNYCCIGVGTTVHEIHNIENENNSGTLLQWKDVSYVCLPENHIAVVQMGNQQVTFGSGRYILRRPVVLAATDTSNGIVDVQNLRVKVHSVAYTEQIDMNSVGYQAGRPVEKVVAQKIPAGAYEKCGSLTFIRPEPGYAYVIQDAKGALVSGSEFKVARGGEVFKEFVDMQHHARTTRMFRMESKDRQDVKVRAQIRWKIIRPLQWVQRKGTCHDIFEAIEETVQALLRDSISACTYEDCRTEAGRGFQGFETKIKPKLTSHIASLGGKLLGFEIREVRFPLLEERNKVRAEKEAKMKEELLKQQRQMDIDNAVRVLQNAKRDFINKKAKIAQEHKMHIMKLRKKKEIYEEKMDSELQENKIEIDTEVRKLKLEGEYLSNKIEHEIETLKVEEEAKRNLIEKEAKAEKDLLEAEAEASYQITLAEAKAQSQLLISKAHAARTTLLGSAFKENPQYVNHEITKLNADILKARAKALASALSSGKATLMSDRVQRELAIVDGGFSPVAPVVFESGRKLGPETKMGESRMKAKRGTYE
mmetsp:Transcript_13101/g.19606  ORF Transcript_13101/g.19606 Transcript_13101/m.19606 type:complete len:660 (-) Transcript_13101:223-2202(-)